MITPERPDTTGPAARISRLWPWLAATALAAACLAAAYPAGASNAAASAAAAPLNCGPSGPCYSPQVYETAYGVTPLLRRGIDGSGETVAMPELAQTPASPGSPTDIRKDLAAFDATFGLPPAALRVVTAVAGSPTPYLANDEELGDAEMVHAFAPGASLDIILLPADAVSSPADFAAAITKAIRESAALHAAVLSISASGGEHSLTPARPTTRPSTTWSPATTQCSGRPGSSPVTTPGLAGTRSPAGAAPTPSTSSPCWRAQPAREAWPLRLSAGSPRCGSPRPRPRFPPGYGSRA
jgi:hypothetical protein